MIMIIICANIHSYGFLSPSAGGLFSGAIRFKEISEYGSSSSWMDDWMIFHQGCWRVPNLFDIGIQGFEPLMVVFVQIYLILSYDRGGSEIC